MKETSFPSNQKISLRPVMVLMGEDAFQRLELRRAWLDQALSLELRDLNFHSFQAGEDSLAKVIEACRDFPCFAKRRVVLLKDLQKIKKKDGLLLKEYLQAPVDTTVLILEGDKLDGRLDWAKALKKKAWIYELEAWSLQSALMWVEQSWQEQGLKVATGVSEHLLELVGNNQGALAQAIEQLSLYVKAGESIQLAHLDELLVRVSDENIFEVLEALFLGDLAELYRGLNRLLETGEAPLKVLALVYRHLSILLALRFSGEASVWQHFRMPPMARSRYSNQVRRFGPRLHYGLLKPLTEMDQRLKSSPLSGERVLKEGIYKLSVLLN